jgi:predicted DNA binding CopG/RHH family protein
MKAKREPEAMTKVTIRLPQNLVERGKIRAIKERRNFQDVIAEALEAFLKTPLDREGAAR